MIWLRCFDKYKFSEFLIENGFNTIKLYVDKTCFIKMLRQEKNEYPAFVNLLVVLVSILAKLKTKEEVELLQQI